MESTDRVVCKVCGAQNLAGAKFCSQCAAPFGEPTLAARRPKSVYWICVYGMITVAIYFVSFVISPPLPDRHMTHYQIYNFVCAWLEFPMYVLLTGACFGSWYARPWGRIWMLRWSVIATVYETLVFLITVAYFVPRLTPADLVSPQEAQAMQSIGMDSSLLGLTTEISSGVEWLGILSLTIWALIAFNKRQVREFFEPE